MLVIFPFEEPFYRERGVNAEFVGHPLAELPAPTISREEFAAANDLNPTYPWIALLPGSRAKEIRDNLPEMLAAARQLSRAAAEPKTRAFPQFILPLAPTLTSAQREFVRRLALSHAVKLMLRLVTDARAALHHSRASIVASGTATVEAALIGNPFVVVYRVSPLTYAIAKRVVTVPHVAMVNLIAQKRVITELIQSDFTASNIVSQLQPLLPDGPPRQSMMKELAELRGTLRARPKSAAQPSAGAIARVAEVVLELLGGTQRTGAAPAAAPEPH